MITIEFVPYSEIEKLSSLGRLRKLLKLAKENKIVLLEGRLKPNEEAELIKMNMEEIDDEFKGIEFAVINPDEEKLDFLKKLRLNLVNVFLGYRPGFTIVGPANIVKEIKKNPHKIELLMKEGVVKEKKKGKGTSKGTTKTRRTTKAREKEKSGEKSKRSKK